MRSKTDKRVYEDGWERGDEKRSERWIDQRSHQLDRLTDLSDAQCLVVACDEANWTTKEIAKLIGRTEPGVCRIRRQLSEKAQELPPGAEGPLADALERYAPEEMEGIPDYDQA